MSVLFDVTEDNFDALIEHAQGPVLLEVGAPRCGPCRELVRVLETLVDEVQPHLRIATTNADTEVGLAARLRIRSLPTLLVFRDGVEVERRCGYAGSRSVQALVRGLVASAG
ncbi:MAG: thioredoxin family protein [Nannocystaceae bacterium]|nr:thioredoxin family protein [Nannocystaceae bacterium]